MNDRMRSHARRPGRVPWAALLVAAGSVAGPASRAVAGPPRSGTPVVTVVGLGGPGIEGIMVSAWMDSVRVGSRRTDGKGVVSFAGLPAGRVVLTTSDDHGWRRSHGAFIGFGPDTVWLKAGTTARETLRVAQRVPPAIYR